MQFWAEKNVGKPDHRKVGPFPTRQAAVDAFRAACPFKGPDYARRAPKAQFMTGHGSTGALLALEWHDA